jgi:hypothetical protein
MGGIILGGLILVSLGFGCNMNGGWGPKGGLAGSGSAEDEREAKAMFERCEKSLNRSLQSRMKAAANLARMKGGEQWIILIMLDKTALDDFREAPFPEEMRQFYDEFDAAVVARLIESLPLEASDALLWSVTYRLSDTQRGRYGETVGIWPFERLADGETSPIRDLARDFLKKVLTKDHGYGQQEWRKEIMNHRGGRYPCFPGEPG